MSTNSVRLTRFWIDGGRGSRGAIVNFPSLRHARHGLSGPLVPLPMLKLCYATKSINYSQHAAHRHAFDDALSIQR
jgi:hypothetical protein